MLLFVVASSSEKLHSYRSEWVFETHCIIRVMRVYGTNSRDLPDVKIVLEGNERHDV